MLYLKQDFNLHPASPATRDRFVELAQQELLPGLERLGGRLVAAWLNHAEWYSQLTHVVEFQGFPDFETFRDKAREDSEWIASQREVATDRMDAFFEPLRKIAPRERLVNLYPLPYSPLR